VPSQNEARKQSAKQRVNRGFCGSCLRSVKALFTLRPVFCFNSAKFFSLCPFFFDGAIISLTSLGNALDFAGQCMMLASPSAAALIFGVETLTLEHKLPGGKNQ
jgi:hypothetical protein